MLIKPIVPMTQNKQDNINFKGIHRLKGDSTIINKALQAYTDKLESTIKNMPDSLESLKTIQFEKTSKDELTIICPDLIDKTVFSWVNDIAKKIKLQQYFNMD